MKSTKSFRGQALLTLTFLFQLESSSYAFSPSPPLATSTKFSGYSITSRMSPTRLQVVEELSEAGVEAVATGSIGDLAEAVSTLDIEEIAEALANTPLDGLLHEPVLWSMGVMLSIVALLQAWEEAIHRTRHALPEALMPVVDSMLAEVGGIGFVGVSCSRSMFQFCLFCFEFNSMKMF
jgi:hypothetical protein